MDSSDPELGSLSRALTDDGGAGTGANESTATASPDVRQPHHHTSRRRGTANPFGLAGTEVGVLRGRWAVTIGNGARAGIRAAADEGAARSATWRAALDTLLHFRSKRREEKKRTLREALESKTLQRLILILVILDLVIVAVSVQFPRVAVLSLLNAVADRGLLVIFVLEAVALLYVLSPREYLRKPWHVIDGAFIALSIVLELHELLVHEDDLHPASPFVSLSIRVWRILRIVHAFTVALELEYQEAQSSAALEGRLRDTLRRVSALESELYHEKHARAALERELARLNRVKRSYDALGVRVPL